MCFLGRTTKFLALLATIIEAWGEEKFGGFRTKKFNLFKDMFHSKWAIACKINSICYIHKIVKLSPFSIPEHFLTPQTNFMLNNQSIPFLPSSKTLANINLFSVLMDLPVPDTAFQRNHLQYVLLAEQWSIVQPPEGVKCWHTLHI